jgi:hypothetical protein
VTAVGTLHSKHSDVSIDIDLVNDLVNDLSIPFHDDTMLKLRIYTTHNKSLDNMYFAKLSIHVVYST